MFNNPLYPKPVTKQCTKTILKQMEAIYNLMDNNNNYLGSGFFCCIK